MGKREKKWDEMKQEYNSRNMTKTQVRKLTETIDKAKSENRKKRKKQICKYTAAAAAVVAVTITILPNTSSDIAYAMSRIPFLTKWVEVVTVKDYQYDDNRHTADISVPEIVTKTPQNESSDMPADENIKKSAAEINTEIKNITLKLIEEFKAGLKQQEGHQAMQVTSEVISTTDDYFTLKLICFQAAGSGYEENYFYTIDLKTGERLKLKDLFVEGNDYISSISENTKEQMKEQMALDENVMYNLDTDTPEWNFNEITEDTSFYLNDKQELTICFNEGEVAPMYMGCVEFLIPNEVLEDIRIE